MANYPTATVLSEFYSILMKPHLKNDMGLDRGELLGGIFGNIRRTEGHIVAIWDTVKDYDIRQRDDLFTPPGFMMPPEPREFGPSDLIYVEGSPEGEKVWREARS